MQHSQSRLVVCGAREAVTTAEREICGEDAVDSCVTAQALALVGRRAACLPPPQGTILESARIASADGAWVRHLESMPASAGLLLSAGSTQQAVDHCLIAHLLAARTRRPVTCLVEPELADNLEPVEVPGEKLVRLVLEDSAPSGGHEIAVIADTFLRVATLTGRAQSAVDYVQVEDAELVLVAHGALRSIAAEAVRRLREGGIAVGLAAPAVLFPAPAVELETLVTDQRRVIVLEHARVLGRGLQAPTLAQAERLRIDPRSADPVGALLAALPLKGAAPAHTSSSGRHVFCMGALPRGEHADALLRKVAAIASRFLPPLTITRHVRWAGPATGLDLEWRGELPGNVPEEGTREKLDLLMLSDSTLFEVDRVAPSLLRGGTLLICSAHHSAEELWSWLGDERRSYLSEHEIVLRWIAREQLAHDGHEPEAVLASAILDAAFKAGLPGESQSEPPPVCSSVLDLDAPIASLPPGPTRPRLPDPVELDSEARKAAAVALWRFHVGGKGAWSPHDPLPGLPLQPAALISLIESDAAIASLPLYLPDGDDAPRTFHDVLAEALEQVEAAGVPTPVLDRLSQLLRSIVFEVVDERAGVVAMDTALDEALRRFESKVRVSEAGAEELDQELLHLRDELPTTGTLVGATETAALHLTVEAIVHARTCQLEGLLTEAEELIQRLADILRLDHQHSPESRTPGALSAALGSTAASHFKAEQLSSTLPPARTAARLEEGRRKRIEDALGTLREQSKSLTERPALHVLHAGPVPQKLGTRADVSLIQHPAPVAAAAGVFDGLARQMMGIFRAMRVARLEIAGRYDSDRHDAMFAHLSWDSCTADEVRAMPAVLVITRAEALGGVMLADLSDLLRSGRPVRLAVFQSATGSWSGHAAGHVVGAPLSLTQFALAHSDAYTCRTLISRPARLLMDVERAARVTRPALVLMVAPVESPSWPHLQLAAAESGRAAASFRHDPDAGAGQAARFTADHNPAPTEPWPRHQLSCIKADGEETELELAITFADVAALDPEYRRHFRVLAPGGGDDETQVPLADHVFGLWSTGVPAPGKSPYIWVLDHDRTLRRAIISRELAHACLERLGAWHNLQELAGLDNTHAHRAAAVARSEALAEAAAVRVELEASHAEEIERVRNVAGLEAIERLAAVLLDLDSMPAPSSPRPAPATAPEAAAPVTEEVRDETPAEEADEPALSFDDPYIDAPLCTTCNECTNLNPLMFKYNKDNQAVLEDATAGTYAQLVQAATKCPARCIHPGKPRPGDTTATPELIELAATFG